jgi:DNA-binding Lrp family transcriptional regulator
MDDIDRKLLNLIQEDFPLTEAPFAQVAAGFGISEAEVLERVGRLKEKGIIRRIGAVFDLRRLGFASTLCAARVPEGQVQAFVARVNTLIAPSEAELAGTLDTIRRQTGIEDLLSLRATRTFKINARFEV